MLIEGMMGGLVRAAGVEISTAGLIVKPDAADGGRRMSDLS